MAIAEPTTGADHQELGRKQVHQREDQGFSFDFNILARRLGRLLRL